MATPLHRHDREAEAFYVLDGRLDYQAGDELFERLTEFGAGNLVIYPNALRTLIDAAEARGERLASLEAIRTVGEVVDGGLRERARAVLGLEIADSYTCQEAGYIALQCPESGLYHLMSEGLIAEVLRPDGSPCGEGETGKVVITDLHNHATPVVRYALPKPAGSARAGAACRRCAASSAAAATSS